MAYDKNYGFKHQGRYARRYATVYGELPSQTIERARYYQIQQLVG